MSLISNKFIKRPNYQHSIINKDVNKILSKRFGGKEKISYKEQKKPGKEHLDNYRYFETKQITKNKGKAKSIVKHIRLSSPKGKETPFKREFYNTNTTFIQKRPILMNINTTTQRVYKPTQNKYSQNTSNIRHNKFSSSFTSSDGQLPGLKRQIKESSSTVIYSSNIQRFADFEPNNILEKYNKRENKRKSGIKINQVEGLNLGEIKDNKNESLKLGQNKYLNIKEKEKENYNINNQRDMDFVKNIRKKLGLDENIQENYNTESNQNKETALNIDSQKGINLTGIEKLEKSYENKSIPEYNLEQKQNQKGVFNISKQEEINLTQNEKSEQEYKNENIQKNFNLNQGQNRDRAYNINSQGNINLAQKPNLERDYENINRQRDYTFEQNQYNTNNIGVFSLSQKDNLEKENKNENMQRDYILQQNKNKNVAYNTENQESIQLSKNANLEQGFRNENIQNDYNDYNLQENQNQEKEYKYSNMRQGFENINTKGNKNIQQSQSLDIYNFRQNINLQNDMYIPQNANENKKGSSNLKQNQYNQKVFSAKKNKNSQTDMNYDVNIKSRGELYLNQNDIYNKNFRQNLYSQKDYNLQQNRYNDRTYNSIQNLPFYPTSEELKYQSKTKKSLICGQCGKPTLTQDHKRTGNIEPNNRKIIGETIPYGYNDVKEQNYLDQQNYLSEQNYINEQDYLMEQNYLNDENYLNDQNYIDEQNYLVQLELDTQGIANQQGFEELYDAQYDYYCPKHGYV